MRVKEEEEERREERIPLKDAATAGVPHYYSSSAPPPLPLPLPEEEEVVVVSTHDEQVPPRPHLRRLCHLESLVRERFS
jgi:hypothetical protein